MLKNIPIIFYSLIVLFAVMKRDIDMKTEHVKKIGKQVSTTLKGCKNINNYIIAYYVD